MADLDDVEDLLAALREGVLLQGFKEVAVDRAERRAQGTARIAHRDRLVADLTAWLDQHADARRPWIPIS